MTFIDPQKPELRQRNKASYAWNIEMAQAFIFM